MKDGWENFADPEQAKLASAQFLVDQALAEENLNSAYAIHCLRQNVAVYPAYLAGQRAWLVEYIWCAAHGYCASGGEEEILEFEEGVKLLLEHGAYQHIWPAES